MELPKIISVDDHVVEPAHVWQTWLPEKYREKGPRVERKRWGAFRLKKGAKYEMTEDPEGEWGDAWIYEDKVIYVQKKFVAIPKSATAGDDVSTFDKTVMTMTATTYDDMRPGCYDAKERKKDFELNWVDGSLPFPTFPRFCGQTFKEADDHGARAGVRRRRTTTGWSRSGATPRSASTSRSASSRSGTSELAARGDRSATRRAACARCASRSSRPGSTCRASTPATGTRCSRRATTPAPRCACTSARRRPTRSRRRTRPPGVGSMVGFNNSMASLGDYLFGGIMHAVPEAEDRVLRGPDRLAAVRARARRHRVGGAQRLAELQAPVPRAAVDATTTTACSAASPGTVTA